MADVADRAPVHEEIAARDRPSRRSPSSSRTHGVAVLAQQHPVAGDAHGGGQADVVGHVPVLPVHGDEELGPGHRHQHGQLALAGMAAHVDRVHAGVDDLHAASVQAVDDPPHRPLVARDRVGADHHHVVLVEPEEPVLAGGQPGQGRHRLPLGAGGDHADLAGLQFVDVLDVDEGLIGDVQEPEPAGQGHVLLHRAAQRGHRPAAGDGGVGHLLDPVDVTGEAGHDEPAVGSGQEHLSQCGPHRRLRRR